MKKILAYFGLIDGRKITPDEQTNFGVLLFFISVGLATGIVVFIIISVMFSQA
jgi:hypothetical protein